MKTELIIVDWDGGGMMARCLRSIAAQTEPVDRVILWDNGSSEPVALRAEVQPFETVVLRSEVNAGFTGGINGAMAEVRAPLVGWINNDVTLDRRWHEVLRGEMLADDRLAAVQPVVTREDGRTDGAGISIASGRFLQEGHLGTPSGEAWGVSATATLYRSAALHETAIEGAVLHPRFFAYYEDVELSARLLAGGWRVKVVNQPLATHAGSASGARLGSRGLELRTRNRYWVRRLHPGVGSFVSLGAEDLKALVRELIGFRGRSAGARLRGILSGLFGEIGR